MAEGGNDGVLNGAMNGGAGSVETDNQPDNERVNPDSGHKCGHCKRPRTGHPQPFGKDKCLLTPIEEPSDEETRRKEAEETRRKEAEETRRKEAVDKRKEEEMQKKRQKELEESEREKFDMKNRDRNRYETRRTFIRHPSKERYGRDRSRSRERFDQYQYFERRYPEQRNERERSERERWEGERFERERFEREKFERSERERFERERFEREKFERERLERERFEKERSRRRERTSSRSSQQRARENLNSSTSSTRNRARTSSVLNEERESFLHFQEDRRGDSHYDRKIDPPPAWEESMSVQAWIKSVKIWAQVQARPERKVMMLLELLKKEDKRVGVKQMIISEICENLEFDYQSEDGIKIILEKISEFMDDSKWNRCVELTDELFNFKRKDGENNKAYIARFSTLETKLPFFNTTCSSLSTKYFVPVMGVSCKTLVIFNGHLLDSSFQM